MATISERYDALLRWVESDGGYLNPAIEIYHDEVTKGSFRVKDSCSTGVDDVIVTLPLSKSLSYLDAIRGHPAFASPSNSDTLSRESREYFPEEFLKETPPHVVGRFFLMQQYLLGPESKWWPYIRTLPQLEHMSNILPVMWPSDDIEFLNGTNASAAIQDIKSTLKKEHKNALKLLPQKYHIEYTRPLYHWAYSIFTSRSFRPSLIFPAEASLGLPCELDDFSVLLPLYDIGNHSPLAKIAWTTDEQTKMCMLKSRQTYSAGEQVFNNYGMKTNAELLLGYGFILPENDDLHNDYVHIKTRADPEAGDLAASHVVSLRPMAHRSSFVGRSKLLSADSLSCLPCFSHIQDTLIAALYESITKGGDETNDASLNKIVRGDIQNEVLRKIVDTLGAKLSMDLEEIEVNEPEYEAINSNQQLAMLYREQCQKVLENALRSLLTADG
ncbi:SET domain-containing protein [Daldinia loculata]|uniref:SET domain-containing protein n=1 Tax=Daldinia loculata TaxID=103429 RepID=UPI0020C2B639|nr:SET domain-containing protein [Daldinia loculata]KAI1651321.1 SET domain-containing protein [Daldinia loculata]KAI2777610.1 SET domain-containing protein [Daldinia loculata]